MKKALLIAALSVSVSSLAFAADPVADHGKPEATPPAPVTAPVPEEVAAEAVAPTPAPVVAAETVKVEAAAAQDVKVQDVEVVVPEATNVEVVVATAPSMDWGYTGATAAHKWGDLNAAYQTCKSGQSQSPVNINQFMQEELAPLALTYSPSPLQVVNTGHTVQVNAAPGSALSLDDKAYALQSFDFHTPSQHYVDGAPYPMEANFVHKAQDGSLAIVGVFIKVGAHNPVIEGIWQNVPVAGETKTVESVALSAADLMPADQGYYTYDGSLSAPPCTEGVKWYVLKNPIEISEKQLTAFQAVFPVNARPIQALGDRSVKGN